MAYFIDNYFKNLTKINSDVSNSFHFDTLFKHIWTTVNIHYLNIFLLDQINFL